MHRAIVALLLVLGSAGGRLASQAPVTGTLRGSVRERTGGDPVRGAVVVIPGTTLATRADAAGRFRLAFVPAGTVHVHVAAIGFAAVDTSVTIAAGDSLTLDVTAQFAPLALPPVDVISDKIPHFGDRPATSVAQVSEQELGRRAVATVDEAIDHVAGVQFLNGQINIRGSTGYVQGLNSRVLMTVDGVPMNQGDRGGIDWDLLAVDEIESVEILKGAGSSLYGSAAFGGVVNVTTRDVPAGGGLHTRLRLVGGEYGDPPHAIWRFRDSPGLLGGADVAASYGTDKLGGRISAGDRHSDGYRQQDQDDHLHFAAKARWQPVPNTRVDVSGAWAVDRYDVPLSWCSRGKCDDRGQVFQPFLVDTTELGARTDSRKGYVAAQVRTTVSPQLAWVARGSWTHTRFTDLRRSASEFGIGDRIGAEARLEVHPESTRTVVVGAEATLSNVTSDIFGVHSQSEFAAYGQSDQRVGVVRVSGGARLDYLAVDGGSLTAVVSPRVGLTVPTDRRADGGVLRASIGRGFRAPTMAERFVRTAALGFEVVPNPNLRPETGWSFEIGHTSAPLWHFLRLDAALFWTQAHDLIEPRSILVPPDTVEIQLQNVVHARIAGVDASIIAAPIRNRLVATLGYTYLSTSRRLAGDSTEGPLAFRPRHMLTFGSDYTVVEGVGVGADFRYASRPERIELEGFVDPRRVAEKVLDLRASWRRGPVELRLLAANVLNYIYNLVPETLAPVRTVSISAVWTR